MNVRLFFVLAVVRGRVSSGQLLPSKIRRFCFAPGRVAGIRFCCPRFIQQARSGGSKVMVVSSTKRSAKSFPRTFFLNSSNQSDAFALASLSCKRLKSYFGRRYRYPLCFNKARKRLSLRPIPVFFSRWGVGDQWSRSQSRIPTQTALSRLLLAAQPYTHHPLSAVAPSLACWPALLLRHCANDHTNCISWAC